MPLHMNIAVQMLDAKNAHTLDAAEPDVKRTLPVQLEGIWPISMGSLLRQICWQVDDLNGIKWAFLH